MVHDTVTWSSGAAELDLRLPKRWRPQRLLGRGGQAEVWLATDLELQLEVAIKVLDACDPTRVERMRREVRTARAVTHPNLIRIFELVEFDGHMALIMDFVTGGTLAEQLEHGPMPIADVIKVAGQVLSALAALHELGVVHRDVKPSNILVDSEGSMKLADLGTVRTLEEASALTRTAAVVGTPAYMSPEQLRSLDVGPPSDLYSLGVTLYRLLAGEPPFQATSDFALAHHHINTAPPPIHQRRPDCPRWLARFIARLLEKKPRDRWPDASAALAAFESRRGLRSPRLLRRWSSAVAVVMVVAMALWLGRTARPAEARVVDDEVVVVDGRAQELWRATPDGRPKAVLVEDLIGDGRREVIIGVEWTNDDGVLLSGIEVRAAGGELVADFTLGSPDGFWFYPVDPGVHLRRLISEELEAGGRPALLWIVEHPSHYPSQLGIWEPGAKRPMRIAVENAGHLSSAAVADLDGDGERELITWGINNPLGYQLVAVVRTLDGLKPVTSPDRIRAWAEVQRENPSLIAFTPLGMRRSTVSFKKIDGGFVLHSNDQRFELDSQGWPQVGLAIPEVTSRDFWNAVIELCLATENRELKSPNPESSYTELTVRFPDVMAFDGHHLAALLMVARSWARIGAHGAAGDLLVSQLDRHPEVATLATRAGELLAIAGRHDEARELFRRTMFSPSTTGPESGSAFARLVLLDCLSGNDGELVATLDLARASTTLPFNVITINGAAATRAFFRGWWDDAALDPQPGGATFSWVPALRTWAAAERVSDPTSARIEASRLALVRSTAAPARSLEATFLLAEGRRERALGLIEEHLGRLSAESSDSLVDHAWQLLAESIAADCLEAEGRREEAEDLRKRVKQAAPGAWFAVR